jgi:hypothetical protein
MTTKLINFPGTNPSHVHLAYHSAEQTSHQQSASTSQMNRL